MQHVRGAQSSSRRYGRQSGGLPLYLVESPHCRSDAASTAADGTGGGRGRCRRLVGGPLLDERSLAYNARVQEVDGQSQWKPEQNPLGAPRCSNKGYMPLHLPKFIDVAHWTAENVRTKQQAKAQGKDWEPAPIPREMEQILRSVGIPSDRWCTLVEDFERLFNFYVGTPEQIAAAAERLHQSWLKGKGACETYLGHFDEPIFVLSEAEARYRAGSSQAAAGDSQATDAGPPPAGT